MRLLARSTLVLTLAALLATGCADDGAEPTAEPEHPPAGSSQQPVEPENPEGPLTFTPANPWPLFIESEGLALTVDRDFWDIEQPEYTDQMTAVGAYNGPADARLFIEIMPADGKTPQESAAAAEELYLDELPDYRTFRGEEQQIAGCAAYYLEGGFSAERGPYNLLLQVIAWNDRLVRVHFQAPEDNWFLLKLRVRTLADSLRELEPRS